MYEYFSGVEDELIGDGGELFLLVLFYALIGIRVDAILVPEQAFGVAWGVQAVQCPANELGAGRK